MWLTNACAAKFFQSRQCRMSCNKADRAMTCGIHRLLRLQIHWQLTNIQLSGFRLTLTDWFPEFRKNAFPIKQQKKWGWTVYEGYKSEIKNIKFQLFSSKLALSLIQIFVTNTSSYPGFLIKSKSHLWLNTTTVTTSLYLILLIRNPL